MITKRQASGGRLSRRSLLKGFALGGAAVLPGRLSAIAQALPDDFKITKVTPFIIKRAVFIKIETNAGVTGWGEASPNSRQVIDAFVRHKLSKLLLDQNPFDIQPLWDQMFWQNHDLGPAGALSYAVAGVDLALWDIMGKVLEQPIYRLLGGEYRDRIPAYCGIPLRGGKISVEEAIDRAQRVAELGFKTVKLRMQIREYNINPIPDPTLEYYTAVRDALPDSVDLFVDPNEGYSASRAVEIGKALQSLGMKYFESPCPRENHRDTSAVVDALDIPVMAGEKSYTRWEFRDLIKHANPDIITPDLIKAGGISECRKIADLGQVFFKQVVPHNTKPTLGTAAALHLMASIPNAGPFLEYVELDTYHEVLAAVEQPIRFENGDLYVPQAPGLGLVVDEGRLRELAGV